jgi:predicted glutamine amidotransferase
MMCDIFAISAGYNYTPQKYLPIFAEKSRHNMNGWGIGFFREDQAFVEKSDEKVFSDQQVHESFQRLARVIDSRIIISHVNCPQSGSLHLSHRHPLMLSFMDHTWLFAQVGIIEGIENYETVQEPRLEISVYTARIFEYLRDHLIIAHDRNPHISLFAALRLSIKNLLMNYPGDFAFFLVNESVLFAFCKSRPLSILRKSERMGDVLLITSIGEGLSQNNWHTIVAQNPSKGKLLVIAGPDVLYAADI